MKIICTSEEKELFVNAYEIKPELPCCLAYQEDGCASRYNSCKECLEENIEWEIIDKEQEDEKTN